jgi:hypothetical protein
MNPSLSVGLAAPKLKPVFANHARGPCFRPSVFASLAMCGLAGWRE